MPGLPEEPAEVVVDVHQRQRPAGVAPGKNHSQPGCPAMLRLVAGQPFAQRAGDGDLPVLAALGVADLQDPGDGVDVAGAEQPGLGDAQAAGVDRPEQYRHDQVPERDLRTVAAAVGLGEQVRQFLVGVDVRDVAGGPGQRARRQDVGRGAAAAEPAGEFPDRGGQALQGRRPDSPLAGRR